MQLKEDFTGLFEQLDDEIGIFSFFEKTPDLVCIASKEGYFKKLNPAAIAKLGYSIEELYANEIYTFIHPDDIEFTKSKRSVLIEGEALINFQNRYITGSGNIIWLEWTSIYLSDKEIVFAIAKDITERRQKELEIETKFAKVQLLASHFKNNLEEDRKYFAFELHGELAQLAAVIKMNISWMKNNAIGVSDEFIKRMGEVQLITDMFITAVRRISFTISPYMLEDFGFIATAEWYCNEFTALNCIPCVFKSNCKEESIPADVKIDFFRICQEALNNINRHALANNVLVTIEETDEKLILFISDDGKGFDIDEQSKLKGIIKMQQRAVSLNSELIINSKPGSGTQIRISIAKQK